jgi:hypothetical protein
VGSKILGVGPFGSRFHHVPDGLGRDAVAPNLIQSTHSAEERSSVDASRRGPLIEGAFRPYWNRNSADVFSLANQVSDYAVLLTDLEIFRFESNQLGPSQATSNGEDIKVVQELLRHSTAKMTLDTYTQALSPQKRAAQSKVVGMIRSKPSCTIVVPRVSGEIPVTH